MNVKKIVKTIHNCEYSMCMVQTFDGAENKHDTYRSEDCIKKLCESLTEHLLKVTNFEKKKIIPLKNEQQKLYEHIKICYICKKTFQYKYTKDKKY